MARPRAVDYDERRLAILNRSAELFARNGYDRTSMNEIALALDVSKALFYHYYRSKDDLLFDIIHTHLLDLVAAAEGADDLSLPAEKRMALVIAAILANYRNADSEHKIQINHLAQLVPERQDILRKMERQLVKLLSGIVGALNPALSSAVIMSLTMSIFGTLNWKYMWFREGGSVSEKAYAELITKVFTNGIRSVDAGLIQS